MNGLDLDDLLRPVSPTNRSGVDLAYTPEFQQLLDAASGQPERVMGDSVAPAVEPDWRQVITLGLDLLSRSKDIRIAILLCQALLRTEGFPGLASGTALLSRLLAEYWDSVHPQLDSTDDNDPTERMNALLNLCDLDAVLTPVRRAPLISSRTFGVISLRDVEIAKGETSEHTHAEGVLPDSSTIDAAFLDCEIEGLRGNADAVHRILTNIEEIETMVTQRVGASQAPDLAPIRDLLSSADALLGAKVAERSDATGKESSVHAGDGSQAQAGAPASEDSAPDEPPASMIGNREEVVRTLDRLCDYYARNEPSSPVPLLLQRARRLVTKDFIGIVQDLAPDAVAQIEAIRGPHGDD